MYLTREAVHGTLRFVAGRPRGSAIVFDYILARECLGLLQRFVYDALAARVAEAGEPWVSTFGPEPLCREVAALGFGLVEDVSTETLNTRYFTGRKDGLRVGGLCHLLHPRV
jgi:O-methyltransferase involved in polyketide biosynthesis